MKPAPVFGCADCGRLIGKKRSHWLSPGSRVICIRCHEDRYGRTHRDDHLCHGTRAGIAAHLGLWP
jgi:hypothetical protein